MSLLLVILILGSAVFFYFSRQKYTHMVQSFQGKVGDLLRFHDDMKQFLILGMYNKYKKEDGKVEHTPHEFEHFVAHIMGLNFKGNVSVTKGSGDFGVDLKDDRGEDLFLGQVKCYAPHEGVGFEPIALIHSQMVKQHAKGGYVITTSFFTKNARYYHEELQSQGFDIELIDGIKLVDYYIQALESEKELFVPQLALE